MLYRGRFVAYWLGIHIDSAWFYGHCNFLPSGHDSMDFMHGLSSTSAVFQYSLSFKPSNFSGLTQIDPFPCCYYVTVVITVNPPSTGVFLLLSVLCQSCEIDSLVAGPRLRCGGTINFGLASVGPKLSAFSVGSCDTTSSEHASYLKINNL